MFKKPKNQTVHVRWIALGGQRQVCGRQGDTENRAHVLPAELGVLCDVAALRVHGRLGHNHGYVIKLKVDLI